MRYTRNLSSLWWPTGPMLLALACSHNAPRDNPLDPKLTPPVELQVALDDTAGTATLTWTRYGGEAEFEEYWVLRKVQGLESVDTLAAIADVARNSLVDATPRLGTVYEYRVSTVNTSGHEVSSPTQRSRPLVLPSVQMRAVICESRNATASLAWTAYRGPKFAGYIIRRRVAGTTTALDTLHDTGDTTFVDSSLRGNVEYTYTVAVVTEAGDEIASREIEASIYPLVASWQLPLEGQGSYTDNVRLYSEPDGHIVALVTSGTKVRLLRFAADGSQAGQQVLRSEGSNLGTPHNRRGFATARQEDGRRLLASGKETYGRVGFGSQWGIVAYDEKGTAQTRRYRPFGDVALGPLSEAERQVLGKVSLLANDSNFDLVEVSEADSVLLVEDFVGEPTGQVTEWGQWSFDPSGSLFLEDEGGWLTMGWPSTGIGTTDVGPMQDFRAETLVSIKGGPAGIRLGGATYSTLYLGLDPEAQEAVLEWIFTPPEGSTETTKEVRLSVPFPILLSTPYGLYLELVEGQVRAAITSRVQWLSEWYPEGEAWTLSMAPYGDDILITVDDTPYSLDADGQMRAYPALDSWVSTTRVWEVTGGARPLAAICLPEIGEVHWGTLLSSSGWHGLLRRRIGPYVGRAGGMLYYPICMDGTSPEISVD